MLIKDGELSAFSVSRQTMARLFLIFILNSIIASSSAYRGRYAGCGKAYYVSVEVLMEVGLKLSSIDEE